MTWKHEASVWRKGCSLKAEQSRREGEKDEGGEGQRGRSEGNAPGMGGGGPRRGRPVVGVEMESAGLFCRPRANIKMLVP